MILLVPIDSNNSINKFLSINKVDEFKIYFINILNQPNSVHVEWLSD